mmetsp:Transcript_4155/g.13385  ORF Transcript_4155/g.13385 Transcript_4155/m.13385 type:complete len:332 (-) Transcript_4155:471-1466(-)
MVRELDSSRQAAGASRHPVRGDGRVWWRVRRALRPLAHAGRPEGGVRCAGADSAQGGGAGGRRSMHDVHRRPGQWQLRQDGAQRDRVWGHAADRRGVRCAPLGGADEFGAGAGVRGVEQGGAELVPDRDHEQDLRQAGLRRGGSGGWRGGAAGQDPGRVRQQGHGQDDGQGGRRQGGGVPDHQRGAGRAVHELAQGPARGGVRCAQGPLRRLPRGGPQAAGGRRAPGAVRVQDLLLRAGHEPDPRGVQRARVGRGPGRVRPHLEGRLHHPRRLPRPHQEGVRPQPRPGLAAGGPRVRARHQRAPGRLAPRRRALRRLRRLLPRHGLLPRLL